MAFLTEIGCVCENSGLRSKLEGGLGNQSRKFKLNTTWIVTLAALGVTITFSGATPATSRLSVYEPEDAAMMRTRNEATPVTSDTADVEPGSSRAVTQAFSV